MNTPAQLAKDLYLLVEEASGNRSPSDVDDIMQAYKRVLEAITPKDNLVPFVIKRSKHQQAIDTLMRKAEQELPTVPRIPSEEVRILRAKLLLEEALETIEALGVHVDSGPLDALTYEDCEFEIRGEPNLVEIADGCADISVVTIGTLSACGISDCSLLKEVDDNNLKKFGPGGYRRSDGKWVKPPDHQPPDIAGLLMAQRVEVIEAELRKSTDDDAH